MKTLTTNHSKPKQAVLPIFISDYLDICDPVLVFDRFMEEIDLEKYMKFPMFKKEATDKKYRDDPFRTVNFKIDEDGILRCPAAKPFTSYIAKTYERTSTVGRKKFIAVRIVPAAPMRQNARGKGPCALF